MLVRAIYPGFLQTMRYCSTTSIPITRETIREGIQIQKLGDDPSPNGRPLVLLFGWLDAKPQYLNKYANLYHRNGFDVLLQQTKVMDVLRPKQSQDKTETVLDYLENNNTNQNIVIHCFSVGGYIYGEMLTHMKTHPGRWDGVRQRLVGQVFDSVIDWDHALDGLARTFIKNQIGQKIILSLLKWHNRVYHETVTRHWINSSQVFKTNHLSLPTLVLYSKADQIACANRMETVMSEWRERGLTVYSKHWHNSTHVAHFQNYPHEYSLMIRSFLNKLDYRSQDVAKVKLRPGAMPKSIIPEKRPPIRAKL